jgi:phosphatidylglycerol:prolipoprotein diacylglycerol transferase
MTRLTNLVQFPGLGLSFELNRVAFSIGRFNVYWYGVCIAFGICLALVFAFRHSVEFGVDADSMVDVILIGIVLGIASARAYYVAMAPFKYESIWEMIAIRDGGLAIYGGIIGGFLFGGLACKWRGVPVLPMFDLTAMGFLLGQCCGRWGNFFNQEAFGCNTTLPWGMYSEATRDYLMGSTVTAQSGVTIDPNLPVHPTFLYESIWCLVGFILLFRYIKKRKFNGDIALRYMIWYGAGRFWIEALRTDSLMLVPSIGLRVSQLIAGIAVAAGVAAEIYFTHKAEGKPLMVKLALTADNKAALDKLRKERGAIGLMLDADTELVASSPRKLFVERTEAYNAEVKRIIEQTK